MEDFTKLIPIDLVLILVGLFNSATTSLVKKIGLEGVVTPKEVFGGLCLVCGAVYAANSWDGVDFYKLLENILRATGYLWCVGSGAYALLHKKKVD